MVEEAQLRDCRPSRVGELDRGEAPHARGVSGGGHASPWPDPCQAEGGRRKKEEDKAGAKTVFA